MKEFNSHRKYYWFSLFILVLFVFLFNAFIVKTKNNFSFEFYFLMVIPVWISTLTLNGIETNRIKEYLRELSKLGLKIFYNNEKIEIYSNNIIIFLCNK